jgi:hypothetical protein
MLLRKTDQWVEMVMPNSCPKLIKSLGFRQGKREAAPGRQGMIPEHHLQRKDSKTFA